MRVRHRTPSIFSISMVDVLCCALGCMILMWINKSDENETTAKTLAAAGSSGSLMCSPMTWQNGSTR